MSNLRLLACLLLFSSTPALAQADPPIDFRRDVWPIFEARCLECHGSSSPRGGLVLETLAGARRGGNSGNPILGGPLEENEILFRLTTEEEDIRMPSGGQLPDEEIAVIRAWLEAGAPWSEATAESEATAAVVEDTIPIGVTALRPLEVAEILVRIHAVPLLGILLLLLVSQRMRRRLADGREARWSVRMLARVRVSHGLVLALFLTVSAVMRDHRELQARIVNLNATSAIQHKSVFGSPPKPFRPDQPVALDRIYYRGNCERREDLFNGGNYRTATVTLRLCDSERNPVTWGSEVPDGGYLLEFAIQRAPNTSPGMYSERTMGSVFLTRTHYPDRVVGVAADTVTLEVEDPGERWVAYYPVTREELEGGASGLVYVYINMRRDDKPFRPVVHYGIRYDLRIADGRLEEGSDLWAGNLFWTPRLKIPRPQAVPIEEWFSIEPIPEIPDSRTIQPPPAVEPPPEDALPEVPKSPPTWPVG